VLKWFISLIESLNPNSKHLEHAQGSVYLSQ
jgi:hypothetical protein